MKKALLLVVVVAVAAWHWREYRVTYWAGPPSDHFDGTRFFNPDGGIGKGALDVLEWKLKASAADWPESVALQATAKPAPRVDGLSVTFVGHATVLIQAAGINILADPIWSERASPLSFAGPRRVTPPGIAFEDLPPIDLVLVSHSHFDHMDLPTLERLREAHDPLFVVPLGNDAILREADGRMRVQALDWWDSFRVGETASVHAVPVYHWSRRRAFDRNKALWSGFVVQTAAGNVYVAGDTGLGRGTFFEEAARRLGPIRLAVLPVGAYEPRWFMKDQHVDPAEAVRIHSLLGAQHSVGVHLRTFQLTDEAIDAPEIALDAARKAQGVSAESFFTLPVGGTWNAPE